MLDCPLCDGSICCKRHADFFHSRFHGGNKLKKQVKLVE